MLLLLVGGPNSRNDMLACFWNWSVATRGAYAMLQVDRHGPSTTEAPLHRPLLLYPIVVSGLSIFRLAPLCGVVSALSDPAFAFLIYLPLVFPILVDHKSWPTRRGRTRGCTCGTPGSGALCRRRPSGAYVLIAFVFWLCLVVSVASSWCVVAFSGIALRLCLEPRASAFSVH